MGGVILPFAETRPRIRSSDRGFVSHKTTAGPVAYTRRCCRDALIQATLDPEIGAIGPAPVGTWLPDDGFYAFTATYANATCLIAVCDHSSGFCFSPPPGYEIALAITRESVLSEPVCSISRTIWSKRDVLVPPATQVLLLRLLAARLTGITLREAAEFLPTESHGIDAILSMAARGLIWLDNRQIISDRSAIKIGPMGRELSGQ